MDLLTVPDWMNERSDLVELWVDPRPPLFPEHQLKLQARHPDIPLLCIVPLLSSSFWPLLVCEEGLHGPPSLSLSMSL